MRVMEIVEVKLNVADVVILLFKANMKSYIPLETAAIFFLANLFLKQGIG